MPTKPADSSPRLPVRRGSRARTAGAPAEPVRFGMLEALIGFHLRRAQVRFLVDWAAATKDLDVSPGLAAILILVHENPGLTQTRLAQTLAIENPSLFEALDKLASRGFVERRQTPGDRRARQVYVTKEGKAFMRALQRAIPEHERRLTEGFSEREKETLLKLLRRFAAGSAAPPVAPETAG